MTQPPHDRTPAPVRRQRGATLLFALLALVVMGLASIVLSRSVDMGTLIMGNLSFKQDTVATSNAGSEAAITWLTGNFGSPLLEGDASTFGYYATSYDEVDFTGNKTSSTNPLRMVDWDGKCLDVPAANRGACDLTPSAATVINGNTVQWVITRLCRDPGTSEAPNVCAFPVAASTTGTGYSGDPGTNPWVEPPSASPLFRVVVRVVGPRGTASYTETLINF